VKLVFVTGLFLVGLLFMQNGNSQEYDDLDQFKTWAHENNITIKGIGKSSDQLLETGYFSDEHIPIEKIPNVSNAAEFFYILPSSTIESLEGKTIYFSNKEGRSLVLFSEGIYRNISGMNDGIILDQRLEKSYIMHEIGHLVDLEFFIGDKPEIFKINFAGNYPPTGYISYYSMQNSEENFAEHFAYYVANGQEFRELVLKDPLLEKKYAFFKNNIFGGIEY